MFLNTVIEKFIAKFYWFQHEDIVIKDCENLKIEAQGFFKLCDKNANINQKF
jgi:hypothetical protein